SRRKRAVGRFPEWYGGLPRCHRIHGVRHGAEAAKGATAVLRASFEGHGKFGSSVSRLFLLQERLWPEGASWGRAISAGKHQPRRRRLTGLGRNRPTTSSVGPWS